MRVLIADDQVWLRSAMRLLLEQEPNLEVVGEAYDIRSLLQATKTFAPDLILVDWELPGLNSQAANAQLIRALGAVDAHVQIIMLSGFPEVAQAALAAGADAFVSKGEPPEGLIYAVQRAQTRLVALQQSEVTSD